MPKKMDKKAPDLTNNYSYVCPAADTYGGQNAQKLFAPRVREGNM